MSISKTKILWLSAVVLFTVGGIILINNGIIPLVKEQTPVDSKPKECFNELRCPLITGQQFYSMENGEKGHIVYGLQLITNEEFAVDNTISYTFSGKISPANSIDKVYVFIKNKDEDLSRFGNLTGIVSAMQSFNKFINITKMDPQTFQRSGIWTPNSPYITEFSFVFFINNGNIIFHNATESPITIQPHLAKLQADTNLLLIKNTSETERTNNIIIALTYIGIAMIPIGVGIDVVLRLYLKD